MEQPSGSKPATPRRRCCSIGQSETMVYSVLIADDHPIVLNGLRALIDSDRRFEVVATAADGAQALESVRAVEPDIAILDLNMPLISGLDVLRSAVRLGLKTRI